MSCFIIRNDLIDLVDHINTVFNGGVGNECKKRSVSHIHAHCKFMSDITRSSLKTFNRVVPVPLGSENGYPYFAGLKVGSYVYINDAGPGTNPGILYITNDGCEFLLNFGIKSYIFYTVFSHVLGTSTIM